MIRLMQKSICGVGLFREPNLQYWTGSARPIGEKKRRQKPRSERRSLGAKFIVADSIFYAKWCGVFD